MGASEFRCGACGFLIGHHWKMPKNCPACGAKFDDDAFKTRQFESRAQLTVAALFVVGLILYLVIDWLRGSH
jgi:hypothetical protein